jgi:ubiquinone/menaquinone biosynthesis C-methylase UbiE
MTKLEKYYNQFNEDHRLTTRHGIVEFTTTMKYILKYAAMLQKNRNSTQPLCLLDVGAGTGRYSVALQEKGFDVTAVELVKHNLEILRAKKTPVKTWQGNAMDLSFLPDAKFDITLLLGPMYHLLKEEERLKAYKEALRVTKPNGYIFTGYVMNEYAVLQYCFGKDKVSECLNNHTLTEDFKCTPGDDELYSYIRLEDINRLNTKAGVKRIQIFAPDGPADYMRRELNAMSTETFEHFLDYVAAVAEREELLGASSHTVDIVQSDM